MEQVEDKLIVAKIMDKVKICKSRNKIVHTEFLTPYQREIIQKELNKNKIKNYLFFGGYEEAEGKILVLYPEKFEMDIVNKNLENIIKVIKIKIPKEVEGKYNHRDYLGTVMKAGLNRNRIGDIVVEKDGACIFVLEENAEYILKSLKEFTRFAKAKIEIINFKEVEIKEQEFEMIKITVVSMRIDAIISSLLKVSRNKAEELIKQEKIFVNTKVEKKISKEINEKDILAIRGYGKAIIEEIIGNNKSEKLIIRIKKYK